jgi:hypothetical protein
MLAEFARMDGAIVRIVIVSDEKRALQEIANVSTVLARMAVVAASKQPNGALRVAGDSDGILPYARVLSPDGTTCAQWRGGVTLSRARALIVECTRALISRHPRRS